MTILEAIYQRRAERSFTRQVPEALLDAAIQAPAAMHEPTRVFAVVQVRPLRQQISDRAKALWTRAAAVPRKRHLPARVPPALRRRPEIVSWKT